MSGKPLYVGIDLGTTNSTAAVFDGDQVSLVRNAQGSSLTPSVVRIDGKGTVSVGGRARRFLETDPQNTRSEFKRLMGTAQEIPFAAAKLTRKPEALAAEVLKSLRADVAEQFGVAPSRAVISVPALFEVPQSAATSEAARLAGFERVELIQEPVASALATGWSAEEQVGSWLVYDLGGGTFDASLLETRDGLLRVVGHDGDNFLGGRDFDWAVVDWALAEVGRAHGVSLSRAEAAHAAGVRKLKLAVEEAKIELTRGREALLSLAGVFEVGGRSIDVDLSLDRVTLEALCAPIVDRSIEVCRRLLTAHGLSPAQLARVVLVGGPTVMPVVRARVKEALGAPFGEGLDPMTLVAQGAALYAATAGLDARAQAESGGAGGAGSGAVQKLWLQYPAMTSDLLPHVIGRRVDDGAKGGRAGGKDALAAVKLVRGDGQWESVEGPLDEEGAFVVSAELLPRRPNVFRLEGRSAEGTKVEVQPAAITIVQGLTISDPPLSRTIGVALADNAVRVYFERGAPLPAKRTFVHQTVESVARGSGGHLLKIPVVQGEMEQAHLCRVVGTLEIKGDGLKASLPAGSSVELTLELDRGGHLSARALIPAQGLVFEQVAHLLVPDAAVEVLTASLGAMRTRLAALKIDAVKRDDPHAVGKLTYVECTLPEVERDIAAAKGGDADAGQKARRSLLDLDAMLEQAEGDKRWPELSKEAQVAVAAASRWVGELGSKTEKQLLGEAAEAVARARAERNLLELQRQLRLVHSLSNAAFYRHPDAWTWMFDEAASEVDQSSDLVKAQRLVREGRQAQEKGDKAALRAVTEQLWKLMPVDVQKRRLGHDSGVR
ncbi:Hsp70 family protein [Chondromyces apiculatus]|uniref:Chaperone protein DnaK n=1 Tax=Chondromyces apiculatus DSM 436 TaxID=1192034 RepID=A0A017T1U2_9BACT|nr:Hsp70 family protein [Chondromyces apiculatus]EYF02952.1 Chaperone protein DnaK [Chondromyces apiculatus DSM 436]